MIPYNKLLLYCGRLCLTNPHKTLVLEWSAHRDKQSSFRVGLLAFHQGCGVRSVSSYFLDRTVKEARQKTCDQRLPSASQFDTAVVNFERLTQAAGSVDGE